MILISEKNGQTNFYVDRRYLIIARRYLWRAKPTTLFSPLAKGFAVLHAFRQDRPTLTLSQIADLTGMNPPTAQRITDTLIAMGYLKRNARKEFFLGPKILTLGFAYLHGSQLTSLAAQYLDEFFERYRLTVNLSVLEENEIIYLARREQQRFLKYDVQPGLRLPFNCTAMGKVLVAGLPLDKLDEVLNESEMVRMTPNTIVDPARMREELKEVRRKGYAFCDRELSLDVSAVAAPVLNHEKCVVAAVNVAMRADVAQGGNLEGTPLSISWSWATTYPPRWATKGNIP